MIMGVSNRGRGTRLSSLEKRMVFYMWLMILEAVAVMQVGSYGDLDQNVSVRQGEEW